jgi:uncharacterized protein YdeI (YjbR/CyaY-like superfamily)
MLATTFASAATFRAWLRRHHRTAGELLVRCFKTHAKERGLTYAEGVDEALCFGWIDGVRRRLDDESFSVRFTPRRPGSIWSLVNIRKAQALEAAGRMAPAGLEAFAARKPRAARPYSYESKPGALAPLFQRRFRGDARAWKFFQSQAPWYRRTVIFWVMEAKREETRERRFQALLECSARGEPIPQLRRS